MDFHIEDIEWYREGDDKHNLGNLLAILNGDGGHHQGRVGTKQAIMDALDNWYGLQLAAPHYQFKHLETNICRCADLGEELHPCPADSTKLCNCCKRCQIECEWERDTNV